MNSFPGINIENVANLISSRFGLVPSELAYIIAKWVKIAIWPLMFASSLEFFVYGKNDFAIAIIVSPLFLIFFLYLVHHFLRNNLGLVDFACCMQLSDSFFCLKNAGQGLTNTTSSICMLIASITVLSSGLTKRSKQISNDDKPVYEKGNMPLKRSKNLLTCFWMLIVSVLLNFFYVGVQVYYQPSSIVLTLYLYYLVKILLCVSILLCLCTPRPPTQSKKQAREENSSMANSYT